MGSVLLGSNCMSQNKRFIGNLILKKQAVYVHLKKVRIFESDLDRNFLRYEVFILVLDLLSHEEIFLVVIARHFPFNQ